MQSLAKTSRETRGDEGWRMERVGSSMSLVKNANLPGSLQVGLRSLCSGLFFFFYIVFSALCYACCAGGCA